MTRSACSRCARSRGGERLPNSWTPRIKRGRSTAGRTAPTTQVRVACSTFPVGSRWARVRPRKALKCRPTRIGTTTTSRSRSPSWARSPAPVARPRSAPGRSRSRSHPRLRRPRGSCSRCRREPGSPPTRSGRVSTRSPAKTASTPARTSPPRTARPSSPPRRAR
ncbi:hypothetical protein SDC9_133103 [bioreactor metagenome]|uniref:Uncharacterized protein n=1 Tax=bioreactor metagenome TaxID=1076179 RepID=A0A645D8Z7_9ZZZZ